MNKIASFFILLILIIGSQFSQGKEKIKFNRDIRPLLSDNCFACHGPDEHERKAELRLDVKEEEALKIKTGYRLSYLETLPIVK